MSGSDVQYLMVPLVVILATLLLTWACRWTFSQPTPRRQAATAPDETGSDFGLLVPVATAATPAEAERLRTLLRRHGLRSTSAPVPAAVGAAGTDGGPPDGAAGGHATWQVLVFARDAAPARRAVARPDN
jgi:hypothetical protein